MVVLKVVLEGVVGKDVLHVVLLVEVELFFDVFLDVLDLIGVLAFAQEYLLTDFPLLELPDVLFELVGRLLLDFPQVGLPQHPILVAKSYGSYFLVSFLKLRCFRFISLSFLLGYTY